jgi:hypothetical protein
MGALMGVWTCLCAHTSVVYVWSYIGILGSTAAHLFVCPAILSMLPAACVMPCAEAQLDRFKSQELGMLLWAVAKLAYMPAASLVRAALPVVAEWRTPAVQVSKWQFLCDQALLPFSVHTCISPLHCHAASAFIAFSILLSRTFTCPALTLLRCRTAVTRCGPSPYWAS